MALEVIGLIVVACHITAIALIILWFASGKPKSRAQFWAVIKEQLFGIKTHKAELHPKT